MANKVRLYHKSYLREHPDGDSIADPYQEKTGAFIFPGDEIVFHSKLSTINLGGTPSLYKFHSVKFKLIAQKPNIFSEEFSNVFNATRSFTLDSFTLDFDDNNSQLVKWGSDGYARDLSYKSNRNFNLQDDDFRKLINIYTEHTNSTTWNWNFVFPILFRWDYWKSLQSADNDFYDSAEINNNKNHDWKHYHVPYALPFGWLLKYRFELDYTYSRGLRKTLLSEILISKEQESVNGFNANSDYTNKSIKTCKVTGTPSNTPAIVLGNENTEVFAYFEKVSAWENLGGTDGEKNNIYAMFWLEPFEGLGYSNRSIASSKYPSTQESVFVGERSRILYDNGDVMLFDNGDTIVLDGSGKAADITFDISNNKKIRARAEIDYQKLQAKYKGINKFTLYCRIYNSSKTPSKVLKTLGTTNITGEIYPYSATNYNYLISGIPNGYTLDKINIPEDWNVITTSTISGGTQTFNLRSGIRSGTVKVDYKKLTKIISANIDVSIDTSKMGECIKQELTFINSINQSTPSLFCVDDKPQVTIDVYGDVSNPTNFLRNDKKAFYYYGNSSISSITMKLQKNNYGVWSDVHTFIDNTYGSFFSYGNSPDFLLKPFKDDFGKSYTGVFVDWVKVLNALGSGYYRMKIEKTDIFATVYTSYSIEQFCLSQWNCFSCEGTVKIEIETEGIRGSLDDMEAQIDYFTGWKDEIRLKGIAEWLDPSYVREYNEYNDSQFNINKPIISEQVPKGKLQFVFNNGYFDRFLSTNIFQADKILITDFNSKNRFTFVKVPIKDCEMKTSEKKYGVEKVLVDVDFTYARNNLRKRNSF